MPPPSPVMDGGFSRHGADMKVRGHPLATLEFKSCARMGRLRGKSLMRQPFLSESVHRQAKPFQILNSHWLHDRVVICRTRILDSTKLQK